MGENETHDLSDLQQRFVSEVAAVGLFLSAETLEALARTVLFGSRYAWLRANWHRIVTQTRWRDDDGPSEVVAIELSGICMRPVDGASLDRAIDEAMKPNAIGQGSAACGASPAPTGCASSGTNNERTDK